MSFNYGFFGINPVPKSPLPSPCVPFLMMAALLFLQSIRLHLPVPSRRDLDNLRRLHRQIEARKALLRN